MAQDTNNNDITYEVRKTEELGRYLVASRDLSPGDVVLSERPLVFGPKGIRFLMDPENIVPCVGCYKPVSAEVGERCAKCGWPVCTGNCPGLTDPRHHGAECEVLSVRPECVFDDIAEYYRHDALLPLRCLLLEKLDPENWKILMDMQSHMECRTPGTNAYDEADEFVVEYLMNNFIKKLDSNHKMSMKDVTPEIIHKICGIIDTNALEIRLEEGTELLALYGNTCLIEHSCMPNTKHTFNLSTKDRNDLYRIKIKTVVPIAKNEHIATMYSHALWGTQARRHHLKDTKYFSCKCIRCSDPSEMGTNFSAMKCLGDGNKECDGIHLPLDPLDDETEWVCNKCNVKVNNCEVDMIISQMGEEVENVLMMGGSVTMLENLLCRLSIFLHPNHYHLYSIKHSLIQLYGRQPGYTSQEILGKKIKMCKDLLYITNIIDPGNARLSLYSSVLRHELHLALVMKSKQENKDGILKPIEEIKPLLLEANTAIDKALECLKDDTEETSGKKLIGVIQESKRNFERLCKENKFIL